MTQMSQISGFARFGGPGSYICKFLSLLICVICG